MAVALAGGIALPASLLLSSSPTLPRAVASVAAHGCPTPAAAARASQALSAARARYLNESQGAVMHADLRQIAHDSVLLAALRSGNQGAALAEANSQLVRHVVQIRVLSGSRVVVDANPSSFDVAGSATELRASNGRGVGRLQITIQDVIGFIKLVHKLNGAEVVVRGAGGQVRSSLPAAAGLSLPASGCTQVGSRRYVVRSFNETSFTGEPLTIWLLTAP